MKSNKLLLGILFLLGVFQVGFSQQYAGRLAENQIEVTTVTMKIPDVKTTEQMDEIRQLVTSHPEVHDFDIKGPKCNFTFEEQPNLFDGIQAEIKNAGYALEIVAVRKNQVFTKVHTNDKTVKPSDTKQNK